MGWVAGAASGAILSFGLLLNTFPKGTLRRRVSDTVAAREAVRRQIELVETEIAEARKRANALRQETESLRETVALLTAKAVTPEHSQASTALAK